MKRAQEPQAARTKPFTLRIRLADGEADAEACRALIARIYGDAYGITMTSDPADPNGGLETYPDRYVIGEIEDQMVACAALYTRHTYVEQFGNVVRDDIERVLRAAGVRDGDRRRRYEYTKAVVRPEWNGFGIGRRFIGATHTRDFLCLDSGGIPPVVLACGKLSVYRLYDAIGVHTRRVKDFPEYHNHARYRAPDDPMESRLVIPELDVERRLYELSLPAAILIDPMGDRNAL